MGVTRTDRPETRQCSANVVKEYNPPRNYVIWRRQCQNWFIPKTDDQTKCWMHRRGEYGPVKGETEVPA